MGDADGTARRRWPRLVLGIAAIVAASAGLLLLAAQLDEMERPTRSASAAEDGDFFVVEVAEEPRPVLVVECDEGVHGDANARFRRHLGVTTAPISVPGGAFLLAKLPHELSAEQGPLARSAVEVLERYAPSKVILIAHSDCLLYDVGAAYAGQPGLVPLAQRGDLVLAAKHVRAWLPSTTVEAYYARKDGARIRYNPVPLDAGGEVR